MASLNFEITDVFGNTMVSKKFIVDDTCVPRLLEAYGSMYPLPGSESGNVDPNINAAEYIVGKWVEGLIESSLKYINHYEIEKAKRNIEQSVDKISVTVE